MRILTPYWTSRSLNSDLFNEIEKIWEDSNWMAPVRAYDERAFDPACEVSETEDHFLLSVDIPGIKKEDLKIEMNENLLTISGERKRESKSDAKYKVQRLEKSYGFFKRSFTLPSTIDADKIEAHYEDGVLEMYLPKVQAAKPRQIEVRSGKGGLFDKLLGGKKEEPKDVNSN